MLASTPFDLSDSKGEKENILVMKDSNVSFYIQKEVSKKIARALKGKAKPGNKQQ